MNKLWRLVIGIFFGSFSGAIWIALIPELFSDKKLAIGALAFAAVIFFVAIVAVFVILGLPAYFFTKYFGLSEIIPGVIYGFVLGMIASVGFAVSPTENLLFGIATFGLAGIISAGTFLYVTEKLELRH